MKLVGTRIEMVFEFNLEKDDDDTKMRRDTSWCSGLIKEVCEGYQETNGILVVFLINTSKLEKHQRLSGMQWKKFNLMLTKKLLLRR